MSDDLKIEDYKELMSSMQELADKMYEIIFLNYFDSNKFLFSLYHEAFRDIKGFLMLVGGGCFAQSASVLRMAIETTSIIVVLEKYPQLMPKYIEHNKFRFSIKEFDTKTQKTKTIEHFQTEFSNINMHNALDYLDYGWITSVSNKSNFGYHSLIKTAGFDSKEYNIYSWVDIINMWVHGTLVSIDLLGNGEDDAVVYMHSLVDIAATLLDWVCCQFHNNHNFNFIINNYDYYHKFRNCFEKIKIVV